MVEQIRDDGDVLVRPDDKLLKDFGDLIPFKPRELSKYFEVRWGARTAGARVLTADVAWLSPSGLLCLHAFLAALFEFSGFSLLHVMLQPKGGALRVSPLAYTRPKRPYACIPLHPSPSRLACASAERQPRLPGIAQPTHSPRTLTRPPSSPTRPSLTLPRLSLCPVSPA